MDFSPYNETASKDEFPSGNHIMQDLGQCSVAWETFVQYGAQTRFDLHESLVMEAKVEYIRVAAINLHIGTDKETNAKKDHQERYSKGGECLSFHGSKNTYESQSFITDRCNQSKRPFAEDQTSIPSSESEWLSSKMEKVRIDDGGSKVEDEESSQSKQFTFAYSSCSKV